MNIGLKTGGEKCCLIVFVDDASSQIQLMRFCKSETLEDYLKLLEEYLRRYEGPQAFYSDKHVIFRMNPRVIYQERKWTTKFHEVLKQLDIELICAHSPQAKGRVERAHGILQDRLVKELRERKISSIETGNTYLDEFTLLYNNKITTNLLKNLHLKRTRIEHFCQAKNLKAYAW